MKRFLMVTGMIAACLLVSPADAKRIGSTSNCTMQEQVSINVNFNGRVESFIAAKAYFDTRKKKIEEAAAKAEVGKLTLQSQNYNVSNQPDYNGDTDNFQINGNFSYRVGNFDSAIKLAEALRKNKMQVNINSNGYLQGGNCTDNMPMEEGQD